MLGIGVADWLVILVYLLGITGLGVWAMRRVHSSASFFIGDRKFGKLTMIAFSFGTGTSSDQAVTVSAKAYRVGAPGISGDCSDTTSRTANDSTVLGRDSTSRPWPGRPRCWKARTTSAPSERPTTRATTPRARCIA